MAIIQKTKNSFVGVLLSLFIAPFETYKVMINNEKCRYALLILIFFYLTLFAPVLICLYFEKIDIYIPNFIESFAIVILLTHLFFSLFTKILFFILRIKTSIWKIFFGSSYLYAYLTMALLVGYGLNYSIDYNYYRLAFLAGTNETVNDSYNTYYSLLLVVTSVFSVVNLTALMKSLAKTTYSAAFCISILSLITLTISFIFGITFTNYINEEARTIILEFLTVPSSVVIK